LGFAASREQHTKDVLAFLGNYTFSDRSRLNDTFLKILKVAVRKDDVQLVQSLWKRIFQHRTADPSLMIAPIIYYTTFDKFLGQDLALCESVFRDLTSASSWPKSGIVHASASIFFLNKQEYPFVQRVHAQTAIQGRIPLHLQLCYDLIFQKLDKISKQSAKSPVRVWSLLDTLSHTPSAVGIVPAWVNLVDLILNKIDLLMSAVTMRRYLMLFQLLEVISAEDVAKFDSAGYILSPPHCFPASRCSHSSSP
jgi:hypothetical protein